MQPSDSSLYDFGSLSVLLDFSPLSVDFESLVINVSRDLFKCSNIEAYIVVSCETVVRSGTDLVCGTVGNRVPKVASASGGTGFVLDGAALGLSLRLDSNFVLDPGWPWHSCELRLFQSPGVSPLSGKDAPPDCYRLRSCLAFASSGQIWHLTLLPDWSLYKHRYCQDRSTIARSLSPS